MQSPLLSKHMPALTNTTTGSTMHQQDQHLSQSTSCQSQSFNRPPGHTTTIHHQTQKSTQSTHFPSQTCHRPMQFTHHSPTISTSEHIISITIIPQTNPDHAHFASQQLEVSQTGNTTQFTNTNRSHFRAHHLPHNHSTDKSRSHHANQQEYTNQDSQLVAIVTDQQSGKPIANAETRNTRQAGAKLLIFQSKLCYFYHNMSIPAKAFAQATHNIAQQAM